MHYAGIDAHRSCLTVAIEDALGDGARERKRVPIGDGEPPLEALEGCCPLRAVVETCPFWPWIHDTLEATEVAFDLAPGVCARPEAERDLVRKVRHKKQLVRNRTNPVNRIHGTCMRRVSRSGGSASGGRRAGSG